MDTRDLFFALTVDVITSDCIWFKSVTHCLVVARVCVCVCVCVCTHAHVCVRACRHAKKGHELWMCACVCVCVREREREGETGGGGMLNVPVLLWSKHYQLTKQACLAYQALSPLAPSHSSS